MISSAAIVRHFTHLVVTAFPVDLFIKRDRSSPIDLHYKPACMLLQFYFWFVQLEQMTWYSPAPGRPAGQLGARQRARSIAYRACARYFPPAPNSKLKRAKIWHINRTRARFAQFWKQQSSSVCSQPQASSKSTLHLLCYCQFQFIHSPHH